jgi:hypothetical protein
MMKQYMGEVNAVEDHIMSDTQIANKFYHKLSLQHQALQHGEKTQY